MPSPSSGKVSHVGLAGGAAKVKPLDNSRFEVRWPKSGQLTTIPIEIAGLEDINDVYRRLKAGEIAGRAVIAPAA